MLRCAIWKTCWRASQRPRVGKAIQLATVSKYRHRQSQYATVARNGTLSNATELGHRYGVFKRVRLPSRTPAAWLALLESGLPLHLRQPAGVDAEVVLDAEEIAEVLLAAQRLLTSAGGIDLLYYLGMEKGRWPAVVWLVKRLVETFGTSHLHSGRSVETVSSWKIEQSLDEMTHEPLKSHHLEAMHEPEAASVTTRHTLDELTDDLKPQNISRRELLQHDALGQIWQSLGHMTIACVDGEVKPEILEIIAYLHHMEIMPPYIYSHRPSADPTAIQQPPTLNLFASRILTSLSDAAWRAHAKTVVEQAQAKGGQYSSLRPEVPGMAYRTHVAGLRPELWLELLLWSCLHGGWVVQGAQILSTLCSEKLSQPWKPLSWRSLIPCHEVDGLQWDKLEYVFSTRAHPVADLSEVERTTSVYKTISSEVVNAYVDALLSTLSVGVGERGASPAYVLGKLLAFQKFLARSGLSLSSGSWDAIILRFYDAYDGIIDTKRPFNSLASISPAMAEEVTSSAPRSIPAYVLDGSAIMIGLYHRALRSRIEAGDVKEALRLFTALQSRTDENKRQSLVDFLQNRHLFEGDGMSASGWFSNNFAGIDYPAFDVQVPTTILGPFLELIVDVEAFEFGKWLLYSDEIDGPIIPERLYADSAVTPALVRFATETNDKLLLSRLINACAVNAGQGELSLPRNVLRSFFGSQVALKRWDAAQRTLELMSDNDRTSWDIVNLAQVAHMMLLQLRGCENKDLECEKALTSAKKLFADMVLGRFEGVQERPESTEEQIVTLVAMLCAPKVGLSRLCPDSYALEGHFKFNLSAKAFNLVLEGVVDAYGSVAGRQMLGLFWPHPVRAAQRLGLRGSPSEDVEPLMATYRPNVLESVDRTRTVIYLFDHEPIVMYGGLEPDLMTVRVVLRQAVKELTAEENTEAAETGNVLEWSSSASEVRVSEPSADNDKDPNAIDTSPRGMVKWAIRRLRSLRMTDDDILEELTHMLPERGMQNIRMQLPGLLDEVRMRKFVTSAISTHPFR